jgi:hypothetical protein
VSYRVVFHPRADAVLIDLWMASARRQEVTRAVDWLERELSIQPEQLGESRIGEDRIAFHGPIGIEFRVDQELQEVLIFNIWEIGSRGGRARGST